jgi:dipeptidase D
VASEAPALAGAEPRAFWAHFGALTRIARPSRREDAAIEHVRAWAERHEFTLQQDDGRNLVVRVPASPGRENAATVTLQGHLDMVCERDPASPNDAAEGRIVLARDGDWLTADGTTLGADNGVAIAAMMALAEDDAVRHGPLELLMTVAEEVGLEGANALDSALVGGSTLLNLDSGEDGRLTVGCAGSTDTWLRIEGPREPPHGAVALAVTVSGGRGGHSGSGIALGRSNAIKLLGRTLREASAHVPFRLVTFAGGNSRNAIPREALAVCSVAAADEEAFRGAVIASAETVHEAFARTDPAVSILVSETDAPAEPWTAAATARLLDAVALVPSGPLAMSQDFDDLVETSTSLGEALTEGDTLTLHSLSRSSNDAVLPEVIATLDAAARLAGGELEVKVNYGGWRPNFDSQALAAAKRVYERLFGEPPVVTAVHAGLETAVIGSKVHGLEMLSFGPQIEFPHSPDERVSIPTVERFWELLVALLDELSVEAT